MFFIFLRMMQEIIKNPLNENEFQINENEFQIIDVVDVEFCPNKKKIFFSKFKNVLKKIIEICVNFYQKESMCGNIMFTLSILGIIILLPIFIASITTQIDWLAFSSGLVIISCTFYLLFFYFCEPLQHLLEKD